MGATGKTPTSFTIFARASYEGGRSLVERVLLASADLSVQRRVAASAMSLTVGLGILAALGVQFLSEIGDVIDPAYYTTVAQIIPVLLIAYFVELAGVRAMFLAQAREADELFEKVEELSREADSEAKKQREELDRREEATDDPDELRRIQARRERLKEIMAPTPDLDKRLETAARIYAASRSFLHRSIALVMLYAVIGESISLTALAGDFSNTFLLLNSAGCVGLLTLALVGTEAGTTEVVEPYAVRKQKEKSKN